MYLKSEYKEHRQNCNECWCTKAGECAMTAETLKELEANETLQNLPCKGLGIAPEIVDEKEETTESAAVAPVQQEPTVIPPYKSYQEYKIALDNEVRQEFEGYVRIGYLLKLARDTSILHDSGYKDLYEFANAEYHLDKSRVSRYMAINDRFAVDGYAMELKEEYRGFGIAKLQLMLQLPDAINEGLTPDYTKSEIQAIKDEIDEENKVTDIERVLEAPVAAVEQSMLEKVIYQLGKDEPELFVKMAKVFKDECWSVENVKEELAPSGEMTYSVRVMGTGRIMLMLNDETDARIVNARTGEKELVGWGEIGAEWQKLTADGEPEKRWEELYCMPFRMPFPVQPEKQKKETKVVKAKPDKPAQQKEKKPAQQNRNDLPENRNDLPGNEQNGNEIAENEEQATLNDFNSAIPKPDPVEQPEEQEEQQETETQIEGQTSIEEHPEWMPEEQHTEDSNVVKGYKAAVTNSLRTLNNLWEGESPDKIDRMIDTAKDMIWRLEQIQKMEDDDEEE